MNNGQNQLYHQWQKTAQKLKQIQPGSIEQALENREQLRRAGRELAVEGAADHDLALKQRLLDGLDILKEGLALYAHPDSTISHKTIIWKSLLENTHHPLRAPAELDVHSDHQIVVQVAPWAAGTPRQIKQAAPHEVSIEAGNYAANDPEVAEQHRALKPKAREV